MYTDLEETKEAQESRIEYFRKNGNQHFTEEGRNAEITVDLVLQARAKLSDDKEKRTRGRDRERDDQKDAHGKIYTIARCCQERFMARWNPPVVTLVFLRKPNAAPKKGIRSYRAIALTSVVSKWYAKLYPIAP